MGNEASLSHGGTASSSLQEEKSPNNEAPSSSPASDVAFSKINEALAGSRLDALESQKAEARDANGRNESDSESTNEIEKPDHLVSFGEAVTFKTELLSSPKQDRKSIDEADHPVSIVMSDLEETELIFTDALNEKTTSSDGDSRHDDSDDENDNHSFEEGKTSKTELTFSLEDGQREVETFHPTSKALQSSGDLPCEQNEVKTNIRNVIATNSTIDDKHDRPLVSLAETVDSRSKYVYSFYQAETDVEAFRSTPIAAEDAVFIANNIEDVSDANVATGDKERCVEMSYSISNAVSQVEVSAFVDSTVPRVETRTSSLRGQASERLLVREDLNAELMKFPEKDQIGLDETARRLLMAPSQLEAATLIDGGSCQRVFIGGESQDELSVKIKHDSEQEQMDPGLVHPISMAMLQLEEEMSRLEKEIESMRNAAPIERSAEVNKKSPTDKLLVSMNLATTQRPLEGEKKVDSISEKEAEVRCSLSSDTTANSNKGEYRGNLHGSVEESFDFTAELGHDPEQNGRLVRSTRPIDPNSDEASSIISGEMSKDTTNSKAPNASNQNDKLFEENVHLTTKDGSEKVLKVEPNKYWKGKETMHLIGDGLSHLNADDIRIQQIENETGNSSENQESVSFVDLKTRVTFSFENEQMTSQTSLHPITIALSRLDHAEVIESIGQSEQKNKCNKDHLDGNLLVRFEESLGFKTIRDSEPETASKVSIALLHLEEAALMDSSVHSEMTASSNRGGKRDAISSMEVPIESGVGQLSVPKNEPSEATQTNGPTSTIKPTPTTDAASGAKLPFSDEDNVYHINSDNRRRTDKIDSLKIEQWVDPVVKAAAVGAAARQANQAREQRQRVRNGRNLFSSFWSQPDDSTTNDWKRSLHRLATTAASTVSLVAYVATPVLVDAGNVVTQSAEEFADALRKEFQEPIRPGSEVLKPEEVDEEVEEENPNEALNAPESRSSVANAPHSSYEFVQPASITHKSKQQRNITANLAVFANDTFQSPRTRPNSSNQSPALSSFVTPGTLTPMSCLSLSDRPTRSASQSMKSPCSTWQQDLSQAPAHFAEIISQRLSESQGSLEIIQGLKQRGWHVKEAATDKQTLFHPSQSVFAGERLPPEEASMTSSLSLPESPVPSDDSSSNSVSSSEGQLLFWEMIAHDNFFPSWKEVDQNKSTALLTPHPDFIKTKSDSFAEPAATFCAKSSRTVFERPPAANTNEESSYIMANHHDTKINANELQQVDSYVAKQPSQPQQQQPLAVATGRPLRRNTIALASTGTDFQTSLQPMVLSATEINARLRRLSHSISSPSVHAITKQFRRSSTPAWTEEGSIASVPTRMGSPSGGSVQFSLDAQRSRRRPLLLPGEASVPSKRKAKERRMSSRRPPVDRIMSWRTLPPPFHPSPSDPVHEVTAQVHPLCLLSAPSDPFPSLMAIRSADCVDESSQLPTDTSVGGHVSEPDWGRALLGYPLSDSDDEGESPTHNEHALDQALMTFLSLETLDLRVQLPKPKFSKSLEYMASVRWNALVANWKHEETAKLLTTRACSLHVSPKQREHGPHECVDSSCSSTVPTLRSESSVLQKLFRHADALVSDSRHDLRPHEWLENDSALTTFLCALGPMKEVDDDDLRHNLTLSKSAVRPKDLVEAAESKLPAFVRLLGSIVRFASLNDSFLTYSVDIKCPLQMQRKSQHKYDGDLARVKDALRAEITCPNEGSLVCALICLDRICRQPKNDAPEDDFHDIKIVRIKNLFRTDVTGRLCPSPLPTGYRHVLVNIRLNDGMLAEIQFQLQPIFNVLEFDGYALHRELVDMDFVLFQRRRRKKRGALSGYRGLIQQSLSLPRPLSASYPTWDHNMSYQLVPSPTAAVGLMTPHRGSTSTNQPEYQSLQECDDFKGADVTTVEMASLQRRRNSLGLPRKVSSNETEITQTSNTPLLDDSLYRGRRLPTEERPLHRLEQGIAKLESNETQSQQSILVSALVPNAATSYYHRRTSVGLQPMSAYLLDGGSLFTTSDRKEDTRDVTPAENIESWSQFELDRDEEHGSVTLRNRAKPLLEPLVEVTSSETLETTTVAADAAKKSRQRRSSVGLRQVKAFAPSSLLQLDLDLVPENVEVVTDGSSGVYESDSVFSQSETNATSIVCLESVFPNSSDKSPIPCKEGKIPPFQIIGPSLTPSPRELGIPAVSFGCVPNRVMVPDLGREKSGCEPPSPLLGNDLRTIIDVSSTAEETSASEVATPIHVNHMLSGESPDRLNNEMLSGILKALRQDAPTFSYNDVTLALVSAAVEDAWRKPRDVPTFHCLYLLSRYYEENLERTEEPTQEWKPENTTVSADPTAIRPFMQYLRVLALTRNLKIGYQATSAGMTGWLEYGSSNPLDRTKERPFDALHRIACHFARTGAWKIALDLFQFLVSRCEQHLPLYHPLTLTSMLDLSATLQRNSKHDAARKVIKKVSERLRRYLLEQEMLCGLTQKQYVDSGSLVSTGYLESLSMMRAFTTTLHGLMEREFVAIIGENHEITLANRCFVADSFALLANCIERLGNESPASVKESRQLWSIACKNYRRAFEGFIKTRPLRHPNVAAAAFAVARCYRELGKRQVAIGILTSVVNSFNNDPATFDASSDNLTSPPNLPLPMICFFSQNHFVTFGDALVSEGRVGGEQILSQCLWLLAVLFVETNQNERGRIRALSLLHAASEALQRALGYTDRDSPTSKSCLSMLHMVENEAKEIFAPLEAAVGNSCQQHYKPRDRDGAIC